MEEATLLRNAVRVLEARGRGNAAQRLRELPFAIHDGGNDFSDVFSVLVATVPLPAYESLREEVDTPGGRADFRTIADVVNELGGGSHYIRYVAVYLALEPAIVLTDNERARALTPQEINAIVFRYIGVDKGYLGDFDYQSHFDFYAELELAIDPYQYQGTTRERFTQILSEAPPIAQATILDGILRRYPAESSALRTRERFDKLHLLVLRLRGTSPVAAPSPRITSAIVERALADAEHLIASAGPSSGVDRVHTAFQGYLRAACLAATIEHPSDASIGKLLSLLRDNHSAFQSTGPRADDIRKIMRSMAAIADALNPVRNQASAAHPNEELLEAAEAMLFINTVRTLLHYIDHKIRG